MLKVLYDTVKNLDEKVKKIMIKGLYFSLIVSIIGTLFLIYYISLKTSAFTYYIGIKLVWLSISFASSFFISAIATDRIKKDLAD